MNPSRPFILRPVATALLMAAILLVGIVAFLQLPVSALPEVDYPTIQVVTFYPGASPDVMATTITAPLERQFGQMQGLSQMTSTSAGGVSVIVLQFDLSLALDVAEQEVQASINGGQTFLPSDLPTPPVYNKTNPADAPVLTLAYLFRFHAAVASGGPGRHAAGSAHFAVERRGPGEHQRRPEARGPHPGQSDRAVRLRHQHGGRAHGVDPGQRELGQGQLRRPAPGLSDRRQRPDHGSGRIPERCHLVPERRAGLRQRRGQRRQRRGKHAPGRVDEPDAGGHSQYPAPARRQHHHGGRSGSRRSCRNWRRIFPRRSRSPR